MADPNNPENSEKTEEELLQEWQNMAAAEEETNALQSGGGANVDEESFEPAEDELEERVLDQEEIDSLLGMGGGGEGSRTGIRVLLDSNVVSYERLPMLDVVFDKFERFLSTSLRHFTADNVEITIDNITSVRFQDYLNSVPLPAGIVVVNSIGLDDYILLVYESRLIYSVVDILLGGRKSRPARIEGRNFTTIERRIIDSLSEVVLSDLGEAFAPIAPIQFAAERMEVNPRFANITRPNNAAILVSLRVSLEERDGILQFCMPYATLEPIRDQLLQQFIGEKFGQDNIWENHLSQELYHAETELNVVIDELDYSLNDILGWRIGDTIELNARKGDPVLIKCGNTVKMTGEIGRVHEWKAVKIKKTISDLNNEREDI
ncbi:MAG: flagellar motor switch protein FliM [Alphaproteobacteria bacterium]|nr:flagellar motor switch protein FliM [Alphaproteobacteria bacterium]